MSNFEIWTDGGCAPQNPGIGGYGIIIVDNASKEERVIKQGFKCSTNNRMELMAVIAGLEALTKPCDVEVISDSKYVTDAFNQHWIEGWLKRNWKNSANQAVKNIDLWQRLLRAKQPHQVKFTWVKGHAGHPENERCDKLATTAADSQNLLDDIIGEVV